MVEILSVDCPEARGSHSAATPASRRNLTPGPPHEDGRGAADFSVATAGGKTGALKLDSGSVPRPGGNHGKGEHRQFPANYREYANGQADDDWHGPGERVWIMVAWSADIHNN
ncbi:MAG: hypothetical protein M0Z99_17160 [Betaproteobacteria bacterium]|nr:hypothetical protein [Betaproteobacteria bacterium]